VGADAEEIARLIEQLGHDEFTKREAASKRLEAIGEPAWHALRKAASTSSDLEIRHRAKRAADVIAKRCFVEISRFEGHTQMVHGVSLSPDGKRLASASHDRTVKVWDVTSGKELLTLKGHADAVATVAFSPDGERLASGSYDQTAKVWDAATGQELLTFKGHAGVVHNIAAPWSLYSTN
jgi:WD40 repeat protein